MSKYVVNAHEMPSPTSKQKVKSRIKKESLKNFRKKKKWSLSLGEGSSSGGSLACLQISLCLILSITKNRGDTCLPSTTGLTAWDQPELNDSV